MTILLFSLIVQFKNSQAVDCSITVATRNDGMSDEFEIKFNLDPVNAIDAQLDNRWVDKFRGISDGEESTNR